MISRELVHRRLEATPAPIWLLPLIALTILLVSFLPTHIALALVVGGIILVATTVKQEVGIYLLVFSVPFGSVAEVDLGAISVTPTEFLIALTAISWALKIVSQREARMTVAPLVWPLLGFIAILLLSATGASSLPLAFKEVAKWLELLLAFLFVSNFITERRQAVLILACLLAATFLEALLGWYQFVARSGPEGFLIADRFLRAYGTFGQPNPFAGYLSFTLTFLGGLVIVWLANRRGKKISKAFNLCLFAGAVILVGILMSFSRGALVGLVVAFAVMGIIVSRRSLGYLVLSLFVGSLLLTLGAFQLLPQALVERLSVVTENFSLFDARDVVVTPDNWAIVERMAIWQSAWDMFLSQPVLGIGPGNFPELYPDYALPHWPDAPPHAHNFYLNTLTEGGVLGLIGYVAFLMAFFVFASHAYRKTRAADTQRLVSRRGLVLGVIGAMVGLLVHNFFDNLYVHSISTEVGLVMGLIAVAGRGWSGEASVDNLVGV